MYLSAQSLFFGMVQAKKLIYRTRRSARTRAKLFGTADRPRLSVYKSNKHIYAQLINDEKGETMAASSDAMISAKKKMAMKEMAVAVGADVARKAKQKHVTRVVFDRGGFLYAGVIKALADAARKEGLQF